MTTTPSAKKEPAKAHRIGKVAKSAETEVATSASINVEDPFSGLYTRAGGVSIIQPPYNPLVLEAVCEQNNILLQAVEVMEVNIDGTGTEVVKLHEDSPDDEKEKELLQNFLDNPAPYKTFTGIKRAIRRDIERIGYGFMEVIRNIAGDIVMLRHTPAAYMRLVALDAPVDVRRTLTRGGLEVEFTLQMAERRFVRINGARQQYCREYGSTREVHSETGEWIAAGDTNSPKGTELIYYTAQTNSKSAYGIPRWINQLPSAVGSRKAEEFNLEFFDAGGMPPVLIFVNGGKVSATVRPQLDNILNGKVRGAKHRGAIVELDSSGGSLDSDSKVTVQVEKFGDATGKDSMFTKYDEGCWNHVREGFRLPPIFFGKSADYNFATAYTAVMLADEQVFQPERDEGDNLLNSTVVRGLGIKNYKLRSKPLSLTNVDAQLKALDTIKDIVKPEDVVKTVNSITGLTMEYKEGTTLNPAPAVVGQPAPNNQTLNASGTGLTTSVAKSETSIRKLTTLASEYCQLQGLLSRNDNAPALVYDAVMKSVNSLNDADSDVFDSLVARVVFGQLGSDAKGITALTKSCVTGVCDHDH